jgi:hypothetical protein
MPPVSYEHSCPITNIIKRWYFKHQYIFFIFITIPDH